MLSNFVAEHAPVRSDRKAIILAGPPGAGKSTVVESLIVDSKTLPEHWLTIDPDGFKDALLRRARLDGSYDSYLMPDEVRDLEAAGERFYPRELATLVHGESAILARKAIKGALERGDNIVIDGTLSGLKNARMQLDALQGAGYDVMVVDVETTQAISEARIIERWERGYLDAKNGAAAGLDAWLGGRWVLPSYPSALYSAPGDEESICAGNAASVAADYGCVSEYVVYRVVDKNSGPVLDFKHGRSKPGAPLVDSETLAAVRTAAAARTLPAKARPSTSKGLER